MANKPKEKPVAEATQSEETTPDALPLSQDSEPTLSMDAAIMETLLPEPQAPGENVPCVPYAIEEIGIQPVALASRTFASDFGPGGAAHTYKTAVYGEDGAIVHTSTIKFQKGALGEGGGINGMADSTLLSILLDRWSAFQEGPFASKEVEEALPHLMDAVCLLNARTREREERSVQGKHEE
jgi:hypothetical protein